MILPYLRSFICGEITSVTRAMPFTFISKMKSQSSSFGVSRLSQPCAPMTPALFTSMSIAPNSAMACAVISLD